MPILPKQSIVSIYWNSSDILTEIERNPKTHMQLQMTSNSQSNPCQKRTNLKASQYLTSKHTIRLY
jgi:hypothetical protein